LESCDCMQSSAYTRAMMLLTLPSILLDLSSTWPSSDVGGRAPGFQRGFGVIGWFVNSKVRVLGNNIELSVVKPVLLWVHHVQNFRTTVHFDLHDLFIFTSVIELLHVWICIFYCQILLKSPLKIYENCMHI